MTQSRAEPDLPVVVIGAGPVGMSVALHLTRAGIPCRLLERSSGVKNGSRAIGLSRRSLQILDALGAAHKCVAYGLPRLGNRAYIGAQELSFRALDNDPRHGFPAVVNIDQASVEQFLVDILAETAPTVLRRQHDVLAIEPEPEGVRLTVRSPEGRSVMTAAWVVACDGAASTVRRSCGLRLHGTVYEDRYVIADIKLPTSDYPSERRIWFDPPANPESTIIMHKEPGDAWRVDFRLRPDEDPEEILGRGDLAGRVQQHLTWIGEDGDWELLWFTSYSAKALTLDTYRTGRVLFAGDAAHLVPIFGARGMNSGLEDSANLSWKLARVVRGDADEELLDTYTPERRGAALENIRLATMGAEFVGPQSRGAEVVRRAALSLIPTHPEIESLLDPRTTDSVPYPDSPLSRPSADEAAFAGGPVPGAVLPPVLVHTDGGDTSLVQVCQGRFTILVFSGYAETGPLLEAASLTDQLPDLRCAIVAGGSDDPVPPRGWSRIEHEPGELAGRIAAPPGAAYLIRPDGFVAARWLALRPDELAASLRSALRPAATELV